MKDIVGKRIGKGDYILFILPGYERLEFGRVLYEINHETLKVIYLPHYNTIIDPDNVLVIDSGIIPENKRNVLEENYNESSN